MRALESAVAAAAGEPAPRSTLGGWFVGSSLPTPKLSKIFIETLRVCGVLDPAELGYWQEALDRVRLAPGPRPQNSPVPYPGLAPFSAADAGLFHGREELTGELLDAVSAQADGGCAVCVIGASGSGKSSLLNAGLVPALAEDGWFTEVVSPGDAPTRRIELAAAALIGRYQDLAEGPTGRTDPGLLLVIDRCEEIFAPGVEEHERSRFIEAVAALTGVTQHPAVSVVLGMRADFYARALDYPWLANVLNRAQLVVGPMSEEQMRRAIVEPARRCGLTLEDALVDVLIAEMEPTSVRTARSAHDPGALPLLSHALRRTWEQARGRTLTLAHYRDTGGIRGAIEQSAEAAYQGLGTEQALMAARRLFLHLVQSDGSGLETRRRMPRSDFPDAGDPAIVEAARTVLDRFVMARLVTVDDGAIEITHEVLLRAWPRLRRWAKEDQDWLGVRHRLVQTAAQWREHGRDPEGLYRGVALAVARDWIDRRGRRAELGPDDREFFDASVAARDHERLRAQRRVRHRYELIALVLVLVLIAAGAMTDIRLTDSLNARDSEQALSRAVADEADRLSGLDTSLSAQLALAAYRIAPTAEARSSLLESTDLPSAYRFGPAAPTHAESEAMDPAAPVLATGTSAGTVQLWKVEESGAVVPEGSALSGATGDLVSVAFSASGHLLVAGGDDERLHAWDVADPSHPHYLGSFTGPAAPILAVAVSADGSIVAAGSDNGAVSLWSFTDSAGLHRLAPLAASAKPIAALAFTGRGETLVAGGYDSRVRLWNLVDPAHPSLLSTVSVPGNEVFAVAVSPDGRTLAVSAAAAHEVYLWNISDPGTPTSVGGPLSGPDGWINTLAFNADGTELAAGSSDNELWIFDPANGAVLDRLPHPSPVTRVTFDGATAITVADDGLVRRWRLPGPVITEPKDSVFAVTFDSGGGELGVSPGSDDNTLTVWNVRDIQEPVRLGPAIQGGAGDAAFSGSGSLTPNGRTFVGGDDDGSIRLFDLASPVDSSTYARAYGPPVPVAAKLVESVTTDDAGNVAAVGADDGAVYLVDISDPAHPHVMYRLPTSSGTGTKVYDAAFNPSGTLLAVADEDHGAYLWDVAQTGREHPRLLKTLTGFADAAYSAAFDASGRILAVGSADGTVRLWNVADPAHPVLLGRPLTGPVGHVYAVAFSPVSETLAEASTDGTIWLWDVSDPVNPVQTAMLSFPGQGALSIAFSPDGETLAAGGQDHTVRLWDIDPASAAASICASVGQALTPAEWAQYVPGRPYQPPCVGGT